MVEGRTDRQVEMQAELDLCWQPEKYFSLDLLKTCWAKAKGLEKCN